MILSYASKDEEGSSEDSSEDKQFDINELKALSDMHNTDLYQVKLIFYVFKFV